jgi:HK97 family phage portal protein
MFDRLKAWLWPPSSALEMELRATQVHSATDYGRDILINTPDGWEHDRRHLWFVDGPGGGGPTAFGNPPPEAWAEGSSFKGAAALPAVLRCTAIIADTIAGLPWRVYRGFEQQPTPRWIDDPQLLREDRRIFPVPIVPDPLSSVEFRTQWITSALWFGDGLAYAIELDQTTGQPKPPLILLDPQKVKIEQAERYPSMGYSYWHDDLGELDSAKVLRLRGEPPYRNGEMGKGILERFSADLELSGAMRAYATNLFSAGVPSGYLKVNNPQITAEQAETLQTRWMGRHGSPIRKIAVLNATTDFVPLSISPVDSQLDLAKTWSLRDIALAFGVPAYMLGVPGDSSTYANVESRMTELRTFTLLPWIRRIEACLDAEFAQGTEVKIITDGTLRADPSTRYASYESALRSGWLTVDEVRALEDRPPLPQQVSTAPEDALPPIESSSPAEQPAIPQEV